MSPEATPRGPGMDRFERLLFLRGLLAMAELPPEIPRVVAEHTVERYFPKGSLLHKQGEIPNTVQFVVRGSVEILRNGRPVRVMGPRTVVGGVAALAENDQGYDCVALEDTVTLELLSEDAQEIFEDHFVYLRRVIRGTAMELLQGRRELGEKAGFPTETADDFPCPNRKLDLVERMAMLRKTLTFAESQIDAIADLARYVEEQRIPAGTVLWREGEPSHDFVFPLCGVIRCESTDPPQTFRLGPGDSVGSIDAAAEAPRWFTATAETEVLAFRLDRDALFDVLEDHFDMAMAMLRAMAEGMLIIYDAKAASVPPRALQTPSPGPVTLGG